MRDLSLGDGFFHGGSGRSVSILKFTQNALVLTLICLSIVACSHDIQDLQQYVEEVKARKSAKIPRPPSAEKSPIFPYQAQNLRDPFDSSELSDKFAERIQGSKNVQFSPDKNHVPEYLESFALDSLRMVGTLSQEGILWALIKTPDSTVQRVTEGNFLGKNYGEIKDITDDKILLTEIIPDGFGGWIKRDGTIALRE